MLYKIKGIALYIVYFMMIAGMSSMMLLPNMSSYNIFGVGFSIMFAGMILFFVMLALIAFGEFSEASCLEENNYLKLGAISSILLLILQIYFRISYTHLGFLSLPFLIPGYNYLEQFDIWIIIINYVLSFLLGYSIFSMLLNKALYDSFTVLGYIWIGFVSTFIPILLINSPLIILVIFYFLFKIFNKGENNIRKYVIIGLISSIFIGGSISTEFINYQIPIYANLKYEFDKESNTYNIVAIRNFNKCNRLYIPEKHLGKDVQINNENLFDDIELLEYVKCPTWAYTYLPKTKKIEFISGDSIKKNNIVKQDQLLEVILPKGLKTIEESTFSNCEALRKIEIPETIEKIGDYAFLNCVDLKTINIPDSLISIGNAAFYGCTSLKNLIIPNSVEFIGNSAIYGCSSLNYNTYDNAYYLGNNNNPFLVLVKSLNNEVKKVTVNKNAKFIYSEAFHYTYYEYLNNESLLEEVIFEENSNLKFIGDSAFSGCKYLKEIKLPSTVKEILDNAFYGCDSLFKLELPNGIKYLPSNLVSGRNFYFLIVPTSVNKISVNVFNNVTRSVGVCYYGSPSQWEEIIIERELSESNKQIKMNVYYYHEYFQGPNNYWKIDDEGNIYCFYKSS